MHDILDAPLRLGPAPNVVFAPFNRRFGAFILDGLIVYLLSWFLERMGLPFPLSIVVYVIARTVETLYQPLLEGATGATYGKKWTKLVVVNKNFQKIGYKQAFLRSILHLFASMLFITHDILIYLYPDLFESTVFYTAPYGSIGIFIVVLVIVIFLADILVYLISDKNQALHDKIAGTYVVDVNSITLQE